MKLHKSLLMALLWFCWPGASADTSYDFVRIACVPANGMLDVEYRRLHDSVAGYLWKDPRESPKSLREHGFYRARGLDTSCTIGNATYVIRSTQNEETNAMNGGCPEVYLDVSRNGKPFFREVVLGDSCNGHPSLRRFTVGEMTKRGGPEAEVCYTSADDQMLPLYQDRQACEWTFGNDDFAKRFPIDEDAIGRFFARLKKVTERPGE
jgi:ribosomal protein L31